MFLKPCSRTENGKRHAYWALVESYCTARGPRHRVVAYLGDAAGPRRRGVKRAAGGRTSRCPSGFDATEAEWVEVDVKRLRVERCLDFGGPWLGLQLLRKLGRIDFLDEVMPRGRAEIPWPLMASVLVLCRLCRPSSELHIAEHLYKHTAIVDLLGIPSERINEQAGTSMVFPEMAFDSASRLPRPSYGWSSQRMRFPVSLRRSIPLPMVAGRRSAESTPHCGRCSGGTRTTTPLSE